jgi:hypothetical protein
MDSCPYLFKEVINVDTFAKLLLNASYCGWNCSKCGAFFDALGRPKEKETAWKPPRNYNWLSDRPEFKFCPCCGAPMEVGYGQALR